MTPENGKNVTKYDEKIQNNRLPVGFGFRSRRLFCRYCYVT